MAGHNGLMWWIDRWRKSTAYMDLTLEEQGAYRNLLDEACLRGGVIPNDERILARACGDVTAWKRLRTVLLARFTLTAEGYRHTTLDDVIRKTQLRIDKQARYRKKKGNGGGNEPGNGGSNAAGNERGNEPSNAAGNDRGNKPGYLDPDPEECSKEQEHSRGARACAFIGQRLRVTEKQHALIVAELGSDAGRLDWPTRYPAWDRRLVESGETFDTLAFVKAQARLELAAARRAGVPSVVDDSDWYAECQRLHRDTESGPCSSSLTHRNRMLIEATKQPKEKAVTA